MTVEGPNALQKIGYGCESLLFGPMEDPENALLSYHNPCEPDVSSLMDTW